MDSTTYTKRGNIAIITINNPPVNGLGYAVRKGIVEGLEQAQADIEIQAVIINGKGRGFSAGADIREFNTPKATAEPTLRQVIEALENSAKPVVAAIHGFCLGGGLELALGCHFRVATPDTQIGAPEVKIGLIPGAGGTQRLPRAVGVHTALEMITSGKAVPAKQLVDTPLLDEILEDSLLEGARTFANKVVEEGIPMRRIRDLDVDVPGEDIYFRAYRDKLAKSKKGLRASLYCVDALEAAVSMPFDEGLEVERALFERLVHGSESKALRYSFFARRQASKIPDLPSNTPTRLIEKVAVIGGGTMGVGISINFLDAGLPVTLVEIEQEALERAIANIRKNYERLVQKGRIDSTELEQRMGLLSPSLSYDHIHDADIVIEAVFEDMEVKGDVFQKLDAVAKQGAILATNTSTLDVNKLAEFTRRPEDVIGTHFFSPAHIMKLLEVVRGSRTSNEVLATVMAMAEIIGKVAVVSGVCDGFIGNRMLDQYVRQAHFLIEEGALPEQLDSVLEDFGFAMGIFRVGDLAGNDIGCTIRERRYKEKPHVRYSQIADRLCERGRLGQKTGFGWYRYEKGSREAIPDPEVIDIVEEYRQEIGVTPREISDEEIVGRCVLALVNEGARILEEGIAQRASDIDVVYLTGYGFPEWRGGPMFYVDTLGLKNVIQMMNDYAQNPNADPAFWQPAPLLVRLANEGKTFTGSV